MQPIDILRERRSCLGHKSGFILLELLAALALTALVVSVVALGFGAGQLAIAQNSRGAELRNSARFSIQFITREVQAAKQIWGVSQDTLAVINQNNNKIVFRKGGSTLWRDFYETPASVYKSTSHPLADQITELTFDSRGGQGVKIHLTCKDGSQSYSLETVKFVRVRTD